MDRQPIGQLLLRATAHARAESFLAVVIIALSLLSPAAMPWGILIEFFTACIIPLLLVRGGWAVIPLCVVGVLVTTSLGEHLLLSGLIVYVAVQYAIAAGRAVLGSIISLQWMIIAYGIALSTGPAVSDIPGIVFELALLGIAAGIGYFRLQMTAQSVRRERAQRQVQEALRVGLSRYLHDSLARSLTMITIQADSLEEDPEDPVVTRQSARMIATAGRASIRDLHELMAQLAETDFSSTSSIGVWHTASIGETIASSAYLLDTAGFDVECDGIDPGMRIDTAVETAFALVFNEVTANIIKHAPQRSTVIIDVVDRDGWIDVGVSNQRMAVSSSPNTIGGFGMGLGNIRARLRDVGGAASMSSTSTTWQVTLMVPVKTTVKEV
ncbi:sensor histidine kinase [Corynebacterium pacaense]|uniref:sensor histidine kinase n=1 Tax=Corynebacterium pacaense TaxID=1816684 RepID=UPI0011788472|nr:histidine kinase [Corynebacterium pacaense]